jgi:hypothetical protein
VGWTIVGVFLGLVALCCIGSLVLGNTLGANSRTSDQQQATVPTDTPAPTDTTEPTMTPAPTGPHIVTGALLGGTQDAFTAAFGPAFTSSPMPPHYQLTLPDGTVAYTCFCNTMAGLDGQQRVDIMSVGPAQGVTWSQATDTEAVAVFLPSDATYVRTIQDPQLGPILVYVSQDLAQTFPESAFYDSNGGPANPLGTLSVLCQQPGISDCSIATGT